MKFVARATAAAAAAMVISLAQPAAAQGLPSYCNNTLFANSFYANVNSDGRTAQVVYRGQFQNRDPAGRPMTATMQAVTEIVINNIRFVVVRHLGTLRLNGWQQTDVELVTLRVNNPAGSGAPSAVDVGRAIRFNCSFG